MATRDVVHVDRVRSRHAHVAASQPVFPPASGRAAIMIPAESRTAEAYWKIRDTEGPPRKPPRMAIATEPRPKPTTDDQIMEAYWFTRPCFACGTRGHCLHREPEVARAEVQRLRGVTACTTTTKP